MRFRASILEMASSEIMQHIPASIYETIKAKDPHPVFRAYVIGHEGISEGKVVGHGNMVKRWFDSAIHKIVDRLQYGTKVFHLHAKTNEHEGRQSIGEIVGKALQTINDKVSAIAITYIKPSYTDLPLNVASMEADIRLNNDQDKGIYDADVEDITAVALGDRAVNRPGFKDATLLSQIQAFADQSQFNVGGDEMGNTINDLRKVIKAEGYEPADIFGLGDLIKDSMIVGHIEKLEEKFENSLIKRRKTINAGFDETKADLIKTHEEKIKEKDVTIGKLQTENIKSKTTGWLTTQKDKRKLTEEQVKFINLNLPEFKPEDHSKGEDEFNKFLDGQVDKLAVINKDVFGKEEELKLKTPGGGPKDTKDGSEVMDDMSLND